MKEKIKANIHNRFDIMKTDIRTGKTEQVGYAENIVLNQIYTRLCARNTYFVNIHYGTGTGTLDASRTSLFTHKGTRTAINDEINKALPMSSWRRKIVLNPEEEVGTIFTEVGIAFGSTASNLVTHAQIRDMNGNVVSITKTAFDVLTIYGTIYVTFSTNNAKLGLCSLPDNNPLVNYLIGGTTFPACNFRVGTIVAETRDTMPTVMRLPSVGNTASVSWTADAGNKKMTTNLIRFGVTEVNDHLTEIGFGQNDMNGIARLLLPATGVYAGLPLEGVPVGSGDGVKRKWVLPSRNIKQDSLVVKVDGSTVPNYIKEEIFVSVGDKLQFLGGGLPQTGYGVTTTPDGLTVIAVNPTTAPFITFYDKIDGVWMKQPEPSGGGLPNHGNDVTTTPDGNTVIAVNPTTAPFITFYDKIDGVWTKQPEPSGGGLPGNGNGVTTTPDGLTVIAVHAVSPFITFYDKIDGVWTKQPEPSGGGLPGNGNGVTTTPDGLTVIAVNSATAPYITFYDRPKAWTEITFDTPPADGAVITADYTVNGIHKTNQRVIDCQMTIQFGEPD